jgi:hypothetical protein
MDKRASRRGASPVAYLCGEDTCLPSLELFFKPNGRSKVTHITQVIRPSAVLER